jgi:transposase-like protein
MNRIHNNRACRCPTFSTSLVPTAQCEAELEQARWPQGFVCPCCGHTDVGVFRVGSHPTFQCKACRHQTSLIAGTLFESARLPLIL